ncbi:MAG: hypothetical protein ACI8XQ_001624, partial [Bermanella sp.]
HQTNSLKQEQNDVGWSLHRWILTSVSIERFFATSRKVKTEKYSFLAASVYFS